MLKTKCHFAMLTLIFLTAEPSFGYFENSEVFGSLAYMNENLTRTTNNDQGTKSIMGTANVFPIFVGVTLPSFFENSSSTWQPKLGYTLLPRKDQDGAVEVSYLIFSIPYVIKIGEGMFDYTVGTSYIRQSLKGTGGEISSSNGGSPATFYAGDHTQTAKYLTVDLGLGYNMKPYKIGLDLYVLSILSSKRSYNLSLSFTYYWKGL